MSNLETHEREQAALTAECEVTANQRLLDEAWAHIIAQGHASVYEDSDMRYEDGVCRYDGGDGIGCAFAPAIKDYDPEMETVSAADVIEQFPNKVHAWVRDVNKLFANEVQRAHDNAVIQTPREHFMSKFKANMAAVAERYSLVCPT